MVTGPGSNRSIGYISYTGFVSLYKVTISLEKLFYKKESIAQYNVYWYRYSSTHIWFGVYG